MAWAGRVTTLRQVASTNGGEWAGPCPICGGQDRFHIQPDQDWWICRGCQPKGGDTIDLVKRLYNVNTMEALDMILGKSFPLAGWNPMPAPRTVPTPKAPPTWQQTGLAAAVECAVEIFNPINKVGLDGLHERGLTDETIVAWMVGWNCQPRHIQHLWVEQGWTIPGLAVDGHLWYLKVRRERATTWADKYTQVKHNGETTSPALLGRLTGKSTLLVCEGEFDAMLAWQEVGDLVDVATMGSAGGNPTPWALYLIGYRRILVCYDLDEAGEKGRHHWDSYLATRHIRLPLNIGIGKDITDFIVKAGGNLHAWIGLLTGGK